MSNWSTDDFQFDLDEISDFKSHAKPIREIPSDRVKCFRGKPSIYEDQEEVYDENKNVHVGIGRDGGSARGALARMPGKRTTFLQNQDDTLKRIRQVGGFGYSNELIEYIIKKDHEDQETRSNKSSSSTLSSPSESPSKTKPNVDMSNTKLNSVTRSNPTTPTESLPKPNPYSPVETVSSVKPPSLFDIINSANATTNTKPQTSQAQSVIKPNPPNHSGLRSALQAQSIIKPNPPNHSGLRSAFTPISNNQNTASTFRPINVPYNPFLTQNKESFLDINSETQFPPL